MLVEGVMAEHHEEQKLVVGDSTLSGYLKTKLMSLMACYVPRSQ